MECWSIGNTALHLSDCERSQILVTRGKHGQGWVNERQDRRQADVRAYRL